MVRLAILPIVAFLLTGEDYYPLREGDLWTSRALILQGDKKTEVEATTRVAGKKKIGETECHVVEIKVGGIGSREYLTADETGVRVVGGNQGGTDFVYETPIPRLKYPLAAGASWEGKVRRGGVTVNSVSTVLGEEDVEVPAGKYRAFKVSVGIDTPAGKTESLVWYAREVGVVKQWVRQTSAQDRLELTIDLKSFARNP
jgi:hypothetical protein